MQNASLLFDDDMNLDNLGSNGFLQKKRNENSSEGIYHISYDRGYSRIY